jgi:hypothetical protein
VTFSCSTTTSVSISRWITGHLLKSCGRAWG